MNTARWALACLFGVVALVVWQSRRGDAPRLEPRPVAAPGLEAASPADPPPPVGTDASVSSPASGEIARLEARIAALEAQLDKIAEEIPPAVPQSPPEQPEREPGWFDVEGLRQADLRSDTIATLRTEVGRYEMERLTLRDRAVREGWIGTPRYREEAEASAQQTREELGEDWYEWVLYASGRPTRVVVADVLGESPAERVGLQAGDALRSYDDVPLYSPRELQTLISGGEEGETVSVEVERNGESVQLFVPRGPLGVRLDAERELPATMLP